MANMFKDCNLLKSLPDISKWNTNNVFNMDGIFEGYDALKSLPNISKWKTGNVTIMKNLFRNCSSLEFLPDLSKWKANSVTDMRHEWYVRDEYKIKKYFVFNKMEHKKCYRYGMYAQ